LGASRSNSRAALAEAERQPLRANPVTQVEKGPQANGLGALARLATESHAVVTEDRDATIARLQEQALSYQTTFDAIALGVCRFDGEGRLVLANRRYGEIYRLSPERLHPGATRSEIDELRIAAGTSAVASDVDLASTPSINATAASNTWTEALKQGRFVQVVRQPLPDGGWMETHEDVTGRSPKRALADERAALQLLIDQVPDYLWIKDAESRFVVANKALATDNDLATTSELVGLSDFDIHPPEAARAFRAREMEILASGRSAVDIEEFVVTKLGERKCLSSTKAPLRDDNGEVFGLIGIARDVTARVLADELRDGQARILEMIAKGAPLPTVLDRLVRLVESQLTGIFGSILLLDEDRIHLRYGAAPSLAETYVKAIDGIPIGPNAGSCGTAAYRREPVVVTDIAQDPLWADCRQHVARYGYRSCWSTPILSNHSEVLGVFAMYSTSARAPAPIEIRLIDVATHIAGIAIERKRAEDRIQFMANHDALTGLPNRALINDRFAQAAARAQRHGTWATIAFVDLDNFKCVNDTLGHGAGDGLLKMVANRMVAAIESTDTVARQGGDEFVILLADQPKSADLLAATLRRIRAAIAEPVCLDGHMFHVTCSFGVANYPDDGTDVDTLLANADAAMYRAKDAGRDNFQFCTPALNAKPRGNLSLDP
jgi:diguanylate cyclase (GGDEF)-like protein/PAS domain S-box-containing protein